MEIIDYQTFSQKTLEERHQYLSLFQGPSDYPEVPIINRIVDGIRVIPKFADTNEYQIFVERLNQCIRLRGLVEEIKLDERNGEIKSMASGLESLLAPVLDNYLKNLLR